MSSSKPKNKKALGISTRTIHPEVNFNERTGAVMPAIFQSATFQQGNPEGFDYTRSGNPNFKILESILTSLEECEYSTVFGSGVSAITAIASSLKKGALVLCEENLYGCTVRLFEQVFEKFGIKTHWVDFTKQSSLEIIDELNPTLIWIESPTNPLLKVIDIQRISHEAKKLNIPVIVDNTFATPILQKPLKLGATISLTSTTKYINGHTDALGGVVSTNDPYWHNCMTFSQKALGLQPSPFDCWLITRGVKTLALRLERQIHNAALIADELAKSPSIASLIYPHHKDHSQNALAKQQMLKGGAIITARLKANKEKTFSFCKRLKLFTMAESLGGVESLICHPATMSHASVPIEVKEKLGINDSLIRLSIGCEDFIDLMDDLNQALDQLK